MMDSFVHLRLHTEFSLSDGIVRIKDLAQKVREASMPAVAITDIMNIYGSVKFYRACVANGVKPIIGTEINLEGKRQSANPHRLTLLSRNEDGFKFVNHLLTRAYTEPRHGVHVTVKREWLKGNDGNVIALGCGVDGEIGSALLTAGSEAADDLVDEYLKIFGDGFYLDIHRYGADREEEYNQAALALGERKGIPVVATNPIQFTNPTDFEAHDIRVCINEGRVLSDTRRSRKFTNEQYLKSPEEIRALFDSTPEALQNSLRIAERCNVFMDFSTSYMPAYPTGETNTAEDLLVENSWQGLSTRLAEITEDTGYSVDDYNKRLEREMEVIIGMGFAGYFLIVADFIQWAKQHDIPVGPGRGSGAGSVVAWVLGITDLNPLKYGLLFERFLNPDRVSLPDFDIDFCMNRRDEVIEYVADRYGKSQVSQIITFGTMAAKAVVRDVGRVLGLPYGFVDGIAKLVPFEIGITLNKALEQEEELQSRYDNEEEVQILLDSARMLEGLSRNVGKHAGGVVIAPSDLSDFVPLYLEPGMPQPVSQFDKDDLESIGLVKFDFLGLRTLTVIHNAMKLVNRERGDEPIDINKIRLDDPATFELIKAGKTTGIFQLESRGMKEIIVRLLPDQFEDLVALVALFRPGPLQSGMVDDFINRKHGREKIVYPHPDLEEILQPTYGVILYQEQVMQIAQVLSGYTLGNADLLRRAMGKKKPEEMAKQRQAFVEGAESREVEGETAGYIFDLVEKFAGYGFNKSHSAAYALLTYQTAWLKTHYPAEFMSASLTADMENTDKVVTLISESRSMELKVLPPDINRCFAAFTPASSDTIIYGLGALKGVGDKAIDGMVEERLESGAFKDLFDVCRRIDSKKINKRVLEALVRGGALDCFGINRASLMNGLPVAMDAADKFGKDRDSGQNDMFGLAAVEATENTLTAVADWTEQKRLAEEKGVLGLYLTGHPFDPVREELSVLVDNELSDLKASGDKEVVVAGLVTAVRTMRTKRGDTIAFLTLDDKSGRIEISVFSKLFVARRDCLRSDAILIAKGTTEVDDYSGNIQMRAKDVMELSEARRHYLGNLELMLGAATPESTQLSWLKDKLFDGAEGPTVQIRYQRSNGDRALIQFPTHMKLNLEDGTIEALEKNFGRESLQYQYDRTALLAAAPPLV